MPKAGVFISVVGDADKSIKAFRAAEEELKKLSDEAEKSNGKLSKMGEGLGKLGKAAAVAGAAIGGAAIGAGVALFKIGESFDKARDTIITGTGASGKPVDGPPSVSKKVLPTPATSSEDAANAIADLNTRLELTGKPLQDLSKRMLDLSRITGTDVQANIANVTRVFGDWGVTTEDQAVALDKIFEATKRTGIGLDRLTTLTVQYGAPLRQLGFGFEETLALFGKFEKEGVNTETVFAGLRQGLSRMAKAGEEHIKTFQRVIKEIKGAGSAGEANSLALEAFGARAGPDMAAAIREGRFELDDLVAGLKGSEGALDDAATRTESFGEKWTKLKNRVLVGLEPLATRVFDGVGQAMDRLGPIFDRVMAAAEQLFGPGGRLRVIFEDLQQVFRTVSEAIGGAIAWVAGIFQSKGGEAEGSAGRVATTVKSMGETIGAAFAAIQAIVEKVVAVVSELWDRFGKRLVAHLQRAVDALLQVVNGLLQALSGVFDLIKAILTGKWGDAWDAVKKIFGGAWDAILGALKAAVNAISAIIGAAMAGISAAWSAIWNGIKTLFSDIWGGIKGAITGAFDGIIDFFKGAPQKIKTAAAGMFDGIKDAFKAAINWIIDKWNGLDLRVGGNTIDLPGPLGKISLPEFTLGLPEVPRLARGGQIIRPGLAVVGDRGPELMRMRAGAQVIPLPAAASPEPPPRPQLVIHQTVQALDPQQAARIAAEEWTWLERTAGF